MEGRDEHHDDGVAHDARILTGALRLYIWEENESYNMLRRSKPSTSIRSIEETREARRVEILWLQRTAEARPVRAAHVWVHKLIVGTNALGCLEAPKESVRKVPVVPPHGLTVHHARAFRTQARAHRDLVGHSRVH
jgi:hypothetical protein